MHDDGASFALRNRLPLFEVHVEIESIAKVQHRAERVVVNGKHLIDAAMSWDQNQRKRVDYIEERHNALVIQIFVDVVFSGRMAGVVPLPLLAPLRMKYTTQRDRVERDRVQNEHV